MANVGMLVCSFYVKKRLSRGEESVFPLNQPFHLTKDEEDLTYTDIFDILYHDSSVKSLKRP